jgi:hypothetical protein
LHITVGYGIGVLIVLLQVKATLRNIKGVLAFRQINYVEARAMLEQNEDLRFLDDETAQIDVTDSQGDWALSKKADASSTKPEASTPA